MECTLGLGEEAEGNSCERACGSLKVQGFVARSRIPAPQADCSL